jgi:hypothetical protein
MALALFGLHGFAVEFKFSSGNIPFVFFHVH